jgi:hypothetical protein
LALFSDTETSLDNQMTAGVIDLEIDCDGDTVFSAQDDPLPEIFYYLPTSATEENQGDIKPGDKGEVTLSLHLKTDSNNADLWMQVFNIDDDDIGGIMSEPECECEGGTWNDTDETCSGMTRKDDISSEIDVTIWLDEGGTDGFQNTGDATEGDNVYQEADEPSIYIGTLAGLADAGDLSDGVLTVWNDAVASTIYYVGWQWELPEATNNCYQGDFCTFDVKFGADQIEIVTP